MDPFIGDSINTPPSCDSTSYDAVSIGGLLGSSPGSNLSLNGVTSSPSYYQTAPIRQLADADARRVTAAQAVPDLAAALKELVENALDAGAQAITVCLRSSGLESIEVCDDGHGISEADLLLIGTFHFEGYFNSFYLRILIFEILSPATILRTAESHIQDPRR
jgi:hypothetical protein